MMDLNDNDEIDVEMTDIKNANEILERYIEKGILVEEMVSASKDQYSVPSSMARDRLKSLFIMLDAMKYNIFQLIWDAQKAGRLRDLFEDTLAFEFAKFYKLHPNLYGECDVLNSSKCLTKMKKKLKNLDEVKVVAAFLRLIRDEVDVGKVKKLCEKAIGQKKLDDEIKKASFDDIIAKTKDLLDKNVLKETAKYEKLTLYVAANVTGMAYILLVPKEDDPSGGELVKIGSRLLASCEKLILDSTKIAQCIVFALDECQNLVRNAHLTIFIDDPETSRHFENPLHVQRFRDLERLDYEFITIPDGQNPAGFLLLTRDLESRIPYDDKFERLYALRDTIKVVLSIMLSKKKKAIKEEKKLKLEEQSKEITEDDIIEVIIKKENFDKAVVEAWTTSESLLPYENLIMFMTNSFRISGETVIVAECKANELASKLASADIDYEKLAKCNEDDLATMLKKVKLPRNIDQDQFTNMILDHFHPDDEVLVGGLAGDETGDEGEVNDDDEYNLQDFFKELEKGILQTDDIFFLALTKF